MYAKKKVSLSKWGSLHQGHVTTFLGFYMLSLGKEKNPEERVRIGVLVFVNLLRLIGYNRFEYDERLLL